MRTILLVGVAVCAACGSSEQAPRSAPIAPPPVTAPLAPRPDVVATLPAAPGAFAPSFVRVAASTAPSTDHATTGEMLADVDSCATCHPDVAAQWNSSAHSFASFGNPSYRQSIELLRGDLGKTASRHCGGCHDMPLMVDGLLTSDTPIPADDLRAHSGVTCRLCHGIQSTTLDGNGSYAWSATPLDAPALGDAASIARHKQQVTTKVDTELCLSCHRGFLSSDLGLPAHVSGIDEPGAWLASAWTGNGMGRVDNVEKQDCIGCHMKRAPASKGELGAKDGTVASHRFVGGHTWMAAMRGDKEQLRLTRAKLAGVASIDVAGARVITGRALRDVDGGAIGSASEWYLPAERVPVAPGSRIELDVVIRNLLAGHRFPGGVMDIQDTWIELEIRDARGARIASSGLGHATDPDDTDTHVLRTLMLDDEGNVLEQHEMAKFRTPVTTHTLAPREARAVRYALDIPRTLAPSQLPLAAIARLRHRSRSLAMQAAACEAARTREGRAFLSGGAGARDIEIDPCAPQPITEIATTRIQLGTGARMSPRPAWERLYDHGMALVASIALRNDEARPVLEAALAAAPDARARAMVLAQLGWVAAKQGRRADAEVYTSEVVALLSARPPVVDAILAEASIRLTKWEDAVEPARRCTVAAPKNPSAWAIYARALVAVGRYADALTAAASGLALAPRDQDLLRAQATSLAALGDPRAPAAQAAYNKFRSLDEAAALRIKCANKSKRCWRDRNQVQTLQLTRDS